MTGRRGFSLLELIVGIGLAGMAALVAGGFLAVSLDLTERLTSETEASSLRFQGLTWLREVFANAVVPSDSEVGFEGEPTSVTLTTRLWVPDGWMEEVRVTLAPEEERLVMASPGRDSVALAVAVEVFAIEYLARRGADAPWLPRWESPLLLPPAVRIRAGLENQRIDTVIFLVGVP